MEIDKLSFVDVMMAYPHFLTRSLCAWAFVSCLFSSTSAAEDAKARVLREYPEASQRLRSALSDVVMEIESTPRWSDGVVKREIFVKDGGTYRGDQLEDMSDSPRGGVCGRVHLLKDRMVQVLFQYKRDGPFVLAINEPATPTTLETYIHHNIDHYAFAAYTLAGIPLEDILADGGFEADSSAGMALSVDTATETTKPLITVTFTVPEELDTRLKRGRVILSPSKDWIITRYEDCVFVSDTGVEVSAAGEFEYQNVHEHAWLPKSFVMSESWEVNGQEYEVQQDKGTVTSVSLEPIQPSSFDLSSYGMSEVVQRTQPRGNLKFLVINILLFVAVGSTILYMKVYRR